MTAPQTPTPPAGTDQTPPPEGTPTPPPASRQERRDAQARERAEALQVERDALAARLDARDRAEVTRLAGEILAEGGDLLDLGKVSLDDLRDADGNIDPDEVAAMAAALVDQRPGLAVPRPRGHANWGHSKTNDPTTRGGNGIGSENTTWADAWENASPR